MYIIEQNHFESTIQSIYPDAEFGHESRTLVAYIGEHKVKCEMKAKHIVCGYRAGAANIEAIRSTLIENNFELSALQTSAYVKVEYASDKLATFLEVVECILALDYSSSKQYRGLNENNLFSNIAEVFQTAYLTSMFSMIDSRAAFDGVDHIIAKNKPLPVDSYREHIVPCVMISDEAYRMFDEDNASVAEVATMIQQNLHIVHITKAQADYIDHTLGYKTTMPEGWKFGDNVFARLDAANIDY